MVMRAAFRRCACAIDMIRVGIVAEKSAVCRSRGVRAPSWHALKARIETHPVAAGDVFFKNSATSLLASLFLNALPLYRKGVTSHALVDLRERITSGHGGLVLSGTCRPVLKGEERVEMRRGVTPGARPKRERSRVGAALSGAALPLLDKLKAWRLAESRAQGVPAFVILHDSTLAELAQRRPDSLDELAGVSGFGARKLERYGEAVLGVLRD